MGGTVAAPGSRSPGEQDMTSPGGRVATAFRSCFERAPEGVWWAPGRVNLIGEHTDYNAGLALPFAIDRGVVVAAARRRDRLVRARSAQNEEPGEAEMGSLFPLSIRGWAAYPLGVLWAFGQAGIDLPGFDVAVDSNLPVGAGLSSSAALLAAVAVAVNDLVGAGLGRRQLVAVCHDAEAGFVGVPVGLLDPTAVLCAEAGHGLLIDFDDGAAEAVPLTAGPLVVVDSRVRHDNAAGAYATRRQECQAASARLGVANLRRATVAAVEDGLTGVLRRRARHVVTENRRVTEAAVRLRNGDGIGDLLAASHRSLRDDFEVSCPELDAVVEVAGQAGADGARLTGAGFGGCVIALGAGAGAVNEALARRGLAPAAFPVTPSSGAGQLS